MGDDLHEGIDEDGQTLFFHELTRNLFEVDWISEADLRRYDLHIAGTGVITKHRNQLEGHVLNMKYFSIYRCCSLKYIWTGTFSATSIAYGLNEELATYSKEQGAETFQTYIASDLNKIAFWNATGSGKTLLLHVNIKQYLHYFQAGNSSLYPDKIILLTPNEGLI